MQIVVVGLNHQTPISVRESISFTASQKKRFFLQLLENEFISEVCILSTCNRTEVYVVTECEKKAQSTIIEALISHANDENILKHLYTKQERCAVLHLFYVATGLDSLVLGEDEVLGQVKKAHELARAEKASQKILNRLFQEAIKSARNAKNKTGISKRPHSISSIAVKYLQNILGDLKNKKVLIVGNGKMSRLALNHLIDAEVKKVILATRDPKKALELQEKYPELEIICFSDRYAALNRVDSVITATAAPHEIFRKSEMPNISHKLVMMDIALPRDVSPDIEDVKIVNLDMLKDIQDDHIKKRQELTKKANIYLEESLAEFFDWKKGLDVIKTIANLSQQSEDIQSQSRDFIRKRLNLSDKELQVIDESMSWAFQKFLQMPAKKLQKIADLDEQRTFVETLETLFDL